MRVNRRFAFVLGGILALAGSPRFACTDLHDPQSPNFHKWITAKQFGERFGVAQQDIDTATRWLEFLRIQDQLHLPQLHAD